VWIIGAEALLYVYALPGIVGIASWTAILYARSLGVNADDPQRMWRPRMIPYLAVLALLVAGLVHATPQDTSSDDWSNHRWHGHRRARRGGGVAVRAQAVSSPRRGLSGNPAQVQGLGDRPDPVFG
jgi:hypothetical protein